jgi:hypothetical protein
MNSDPRLGALGYTIDPRTQSVREITVGLPTRYIASGAPTFFVKTTQGRISTWHIVSEMRESDAATVVLATHDTTELPQLGDPGDLYFIDRSTGIQHVAPIYVTAAPTPVPIINNGTFTQLNIGTSPSLPSNWAESGDPGVSYWAEPLPDSKTGVRLSVANLNGSPSASASLIQQTTVPFTMLHVRLRAHQDCVVRTTPAGAVIVAVAGVGVSASSGASVTFCTSSGHAHALRRIGTTNGFVDLIPGRVGAWNELTLDLRKIWPLLGNGPLPATPLIVSLVTSMGAPNLDRPWTTLDVQSIEAKP